MAETPQFSDTPGEKKEKPAVSGLTVEKVQKEMDAWYAKNTVGTPHPIIGNVEKHFEKRMAAAKALENGRKQEAQPAESSAPSDTPVPKAPERKEREAEERKQEDPEKKLDGALQTPSLSETPEKLKEQHLALLKEYDKLSKDELLAKINPEFVKEHQKNGTLHVLMLAIAAKDKGNAIESSGDKFRYYEQMLENFIEEGQALQKKIQEMDGMGVDQMRAGLTGEPFGSFFVQEGGLPRVNFRIEDLTDDQVKTLYEICLLEQHVRDAGIAYGGSSSYSAFIPKDRWNVSRQSDCNGTANFYACVAAFSGSERLQQAMGMLDVDGHAQLCFDLGKDANGRPVKFSKNTSYVDMSPGQVDPETGKQKEGPEPHAHNFYDFGRDQDKYGLNPAANLRKPERFIGSEIAEISDAEAFASETTEVLQEDLKLFEKILALNPHSPTACSNAMSCLLELNDRKVLDDATTEAKALAIMGPYIDASFYSLFDVVNLTKKFGADRMQPLIDKYVSRITEDSTVFLRFVRTPLIEQMQREGGMEAGNRKAMEGNVDIKNRLRIMSLVQSLKAGPPKDKCEQAAAICQNELNGKEWQPYLNAPRG